jgi:hypothetical protein
MGLNLVETAYRAGQIDKEGAVNLNSELVAPLQSLIAPFKKEETGGRIWFPDGTKIWVVSPQFTGINEKRLILKDEEHKSVALVTLSQNQGELVQTFDDNKFLDILRTVREHASDPGKSEAIYTFERQAHQNEVEQLLKDCGRILGGKPYKELICLGAGFNLERSKEPVLHTAHLHKVGENHYSILLGIEGTSPQKILERKTIIYILSREEQIAEPSLCEHYLKVVDEAWENYPDPFVIFPGRPNPSEVAREAWIRERLNSFYTYEFTHTHFTLLSIILNSGMEVLQETPQK